MSAELPEGSPQFSVVQFFADGTHEYVMRFQTAQTAAKCAVHYATSVGAHIGTTRRVIITDAGDYTVWEWQHGKGVTFPPEWRGADLSRG